MCNGVVDACIWHFYAVFSAIILIHCLNYPKHLSDQKGPDNRESIVSSYHVIFDVRIYI